MLRCHEQGDRHPVVMELRPTAGRGSEQVSGRVRASWDSGIVTINSDGRYRVLRNRRDHFVIQMQVDNMDFTIDARDGRARFRGTWDSRRIDTDAAVEATNPGFRIVFTDPAGDRQTLTWTP
jgi:hypothetical protein